MALLIGVMGMMSTFASAGYVLYNDGLRCILTNDDLKCAQDTLCHWVMPADSENITQGQCVPRKNFVLQDGQAVRLSSGCAIVEGRKNCEDYEPMDCTWDINYKRCMHHPCALISDETACGQNDSCAWNSESSTCRIRSA